MRLVRLSFALVIVAITLFVALPHPTHAQITDPLDEACSQNGDASICQDRSRDNPIFGPKGLVTRATQIVTVAVGAAAVIMIIIGGFRYVLSAGDSNATKSAKDMILYAVVGLVIALVAQALVLFVLRRL